MEKYLSTKNYELLKERSKVTGLSLSVLIDVMVGEYFAREKIADEKNQKAIDEFMKEIETE